MLVYKALHNLRPGAVWNLVGDEYSGIEWLDENLTPPTSEEIEQEIQRIIVEEQRLAYQELRRNEYPSFADQFDLLYHGGYDAWKAAIDQIKDKYPKPEA